jgi:crotonobetainyl-CoA:carnitine CoA-transferase CaiB-like acyl-CoA transferase
MDSSVNRRSPPAGIDPVQMPCINTGAGFGFLSGIRVLDLSTSVAGPYAAMLLGDMGADVIKIERPRVGDDARAWGPPFLDGESLWYVSVNRNKRSVTLDIASPRGREVLGALLKESDVVLINQPLRVQTKLGVDAAACRSIRQDIVHVSITGFGLRGERSDWPCYDLIAEGYSGIMDITGEPDGPAQKIGAPAADMLAGQDAAFAAVAALFERARTGQGREIDVALVDSMTRFLSCRMVPYLSSQELPRRSGGRDSVIAIYQSFETADLPITLGLGNDLIWKRFWSAVGRPEIGEQIHYKSNADRRTHRTEIVARIQEILSERPRAYWLELFSRNRVPAGPIYRLDEVAQDQGLLDRGLFYTLNADGRQLPQVGTGFLVDGEANLPRMGPPRLGASTTEVLRVLAKLDDAEIETLKRDGVI